MACHEPVCLHSRCLPHNPAPSLTLTSLHYLPAPPPTPPTARYSALEVLFDILKFHGASFSPQFWLRVFDSVLLPIFDHVRAEVSEPGCCYGGREQKLGLCCSV